MSEQAPRYEIDLIREAFKRIEQLEHDNEALRAIVDAHLTECLWPAQTIEELT